MSIHINLVGYPVDRGQSMGPFLEFLSELNSREGEAIPGYKRSIA